MPCCQSDRSCSPDWLRWAAGVFARGEAIPVRRVRGFRFCQGRELSYPAMTGRGWIEQHENSKPSD
jgi:hypothetical protein